MPVRVHVRVSCSVLRVSLDRSCDLMEKEHAAWLLSKRGWFALGSDELGALSELERSALEGRERARRERAQLSAEVRRIRGLVSRFRTHVSQPTDAEAFVEQLRSLMEQIEEALAALKGAQQAKWVRMALEEKDLTAQTQSLLAGFERWAEEDAAAAAAGETATPLRKKKAAAAKSTLATMMAGAAADEDGDGANSQGTSASAGESASIQEIRAAISRVEAEIESEGGPSGGWDPRDHAHFLKLHTQHASSAAVLCARIASEVSAQTPATAMLHMEWYERYRALIAHKKELIARWKDAKAARTDLDAAAEQLLQRQEQEKEEKRQMCVASRKQTPTRGGQKGVARRCLVCIRCSICVRLIVLFFRFCLLFFLFFVFLTLQE